MPSVLKPVLGSYQFITELIFIALVYFIDTHDSFFLSGPLSARVVALNKGVLTLLATITSLSGSVSSNPFIAFVLFGVLSLSDIS